MFCNKGFLKNFEKFIGKHLCQSLAVLYLKRGSDTCISCKFCKMFKNTYFYRTLLVVVSMVFIGLSRLSKIKKLTDVFQGLSALQLKNLPTGTSIDWIFDSIYRVIYYKTRERELTVVFQFSKLSSCAYLRIYPYISIHS